MIIISFIMCLNCLCVTMEPIVPLLKCLFLTILGRRFYLILSDFPHITVLKCLNFTARLTNIIMSISLFVCYETLKFIKLLFDIITGHKQTNTKRNKS